MGKIRPILVAMVLVTVISAVAWQVLGSHEPHYQGKGLTAWLKDLNTGPIIQGDFTGKTHDAAADAFRHMGTNALPQLLAGLRAKDSRFKTAWMKAFRNQPVFRDFFHPADECRGDAAQAFKELGAIAKPAIPELTRLLNDPDLSLESAFCLAFIGSDGIPPLIKALTSSHAQVRSCAAFALGCKPDIARPAVPELLKLLNDPDAYVRLRASGALMSIAPEAAAPKMGTLQ